MAEQREGTREEHEVAEVLRAGPSMEDLQTAHHVRFQEKERVGLELLLLSDVSHYGVCVPPESSILVGGWRASALGTEAIWYMALTNELPLSHYTWFGL